MGPLSVAKATAFPSGASARSDMSPGSLMMRSGFVRRISSARRVQADPSNRAAESRTRIENTPVIRKETKHSTSESRRYLSTTLRDLKRSGDLGGVVAVDYGGDGLDEAAEDVAA